LAEPTSVPAGVYSKTFFERVGIWDALAPKKVKIAFEVPPAEGPVISYPFALVKGRRRRPPRSSRSRTR